MDAKQQTKKVVFCCRNHGVLSEQVEYFHTDIGSSVMIDISVMRCPECQKYYTPFTNLLTFKKLFYKGQAVYGSQSAIRKGIPRIEVRCPQLVDIEEYNRRLELEKEEKIAKHKQYIDERREVEHNSIILTNKPCFVKEHKCPNCKGSTKKEYVKIKQRWKFVLANIRRCERCDFEYITPQQLENICDKAEKRLRGNYKYPFVSPLGMQCEFRDDDYKCLFIPEWALDISKYDHHHLPPIGDTFYDMSDEEYLWVKDYFQPEEFQGKLRQKSFLGEAGYSANESEVRRHNILKRCVEEYGKDRVIYQIKSNMNMRLRQKDGEIRYVNALNVWRSDIAYVENKL